MKRWIQALLGITLAVSVIACSSEKRADETTPASNPGAIGTTGAAADRDFIQVQLEGGHAEVELAKLASERATHPQVKEFAQRLERDHQSAAEALRQAASSANIAVNPPAEPDADQKMAQEELSKLSGREFDRKYIDMMVDKHEKAVSTLEGRTDTATVQIKEWVANTLPVVRQHLDQARQIQKTLSEKAE